MTGVARAVAFALGLAATDVGTVLFTDQEAEIPRNYLLKGGFLWVDDFWGPYAWDNWVGQISKVLSPAQFPIRDLGLDHPIRRTLFEFTDLPQIPSISFSPQGYAVGLDVVLYGMTH